MKRKTSIAGVVLILGIFIISCTMFYLNSLTYKIQKALKGKDCNVSAAVISKRGEFLYNNKKVPLLSVFKYFIAYSVLKKLESDGDTLNKIIFVNEDMLDKNAYSPLLKKYSPPFKISIEELIKYMISKSDNNAADILIEYIGGIHTLRKDLAKAGFCGIEIYANEKIMQSGLIYQSLNKAKPLDVLRFMRFSLENESDISDNSKEFLSKIMIETITGEDKIKAGLPDNAVFGHKTGSSSRTPDGVKIADNDAGFVSFPDGSKCYTAVFVTDSKMSDKENAALIAEISKIIYSYATKE